MDEKRGKDEKRGQDSLIMEEEKQSEVQKPQDMDQVQEQQPDLQIVEEVKGEDYVDYVDNLNALEDEELLPDQPDEEGEAGGGEPGLDEPVDGGQQENENPDAQQSDESFDEFDDEEIDRLMNTAHDDESEIEFTNKQKAERQQIVFNSVSRSVFRAAKKVGVLVKFD